MKVDADNTTGLSRFVFSEYTQSEHLQLEAYPSGGIKTLTRHLFGDSDTPLKVYIRDCYKTLAEKIHTLIKTKNVLIAGTRGIGKSTLGFLMVFDFADKGDIVVYSHKNEHVMVLGENVNPDKFIRMNVILQANGYDPIVEKAVYSFKSKDSDLFTYFSKDENFRFV